MGFLRPEAVGKSYPDVTYEVTREKIAAYLESYGDTPTIYENSSPLMYAVVFAFEAGAAPVFDTDVAEDPARMLRRLVRGSLDIELVRPVCPGERVVTTATVENIEQKSSGELLTIVTRSRTPNGEPIATVRNIHFIRGETPPEEKSKGAVGTSNVTDISTRATKPDLPRPSLNPVDFTYAFVVPEAMPALYADASLDRNPLHTDPAFARKVGFPNVILQGSATLAVAQRGIVASLCPDAPSRLFKLSCRFAKPVFPGDNLIVRGQKSGTFDVVNAKHIPVLESGAFALRP